MDHDQQRSEPLDCYVALELSRRTWLVGALLPDSTKVRTFTVQGGDAVALLQGLHRLKERAAKNGFDDIRLQVALKLDMTGSGSPAFLLTQASRPRFWTPAAFWSRDVVGE